MSHAPQGVTGKLSAYKTTPSSLIEVEGFNVRTDMGDIESLSQSIVDNGLERPLNVIRSKDQEDKFQVIDGHRRYTAILLAVKADKIDPATFEVPIMIAARGTTDADMLAMMARANDGKALLPLEEAALFKRMLDAKVPMVDVCKKVGHSDMYVRQHLDLLNAAPEVKEALEKGEIAKTLALNIATQARKSGGKLDTAALVAQATSSKEGKREVTLKTDVYQAKQRAIRVKLDAIKEDLATVKAGVKEALAEAGMSRANLKTAKYYDLIHLLGREAALKDLVTENTPAEE